MPIRIPLTRGLFAIVDNADAPVLLMHNWQSTSDGANGWYAVRTVRQKTLRMHRFLIQAPPSMSVDHINGDGLDNRRANLRLCLHRENMRNRKLNCNNLVGFKGVRRLHERYQARICLDGTMRYLGVFATPEEAARAYDVAAQHLHGAFARLNFPNENGAGLQPCAVTETALPAADYPTHPTPSAVTQHKEWST